MKKGRGGRWAFWEAVAGGALLLLFLAGATLAIAPGADETASITQKREDHPLWHGQLTGARLDRRMEAFSVAFEHREAPARLFGTFLDQIGVERIIHYIEGENPACHGALHALGAALVERTEDLKSAMMLCGNACTFACVHGAITHALATALPKQDEGIFPRNRKTEALLQREVLSLCREDSQTVRDFFSGNCAHAVGHGFAERSADLSRAKADCALFPDAERHYYCESGVFMELRPILAEKIYQGESSRSRRREIALRFCIENSEWPSACLRFFLEPMRRPEEIDALRSRCGALDGPARRGCFHTLGYISRDYVASQPEEINRVCRSDRSDDPSDPVFCISGLAFVKKNHRLKEKLERACGFLMDAALKEVCDDQHRRSYYQVDNRIMRSMLSDTKSISPADGAGHPSRSGYSRD